MQEGKRASDASLRGELLFTWHISARWVTNHRIPMWHFEAQDSQMLMGGMGSIALRVKLTASQPNPGLPGEGREVWFGEAGKNRGCRQLLPTCGPCSFSKPSLPVPWTSRAVSQPCNDNICTISATLFYSFSIHSLARPRPQTVPG